MTNLDYIMPMAFRRIYFLVYPGFELLDLTGPLSVFNAANQVGDEPVYEIETFSLRGGLVCSSSGLRVETQSLDSAVIDSVVTVLVVGAERPYIEQAIANVEHLTWLKSLPSKVERYGSVCSGTFLLQAAGLIDNKVVTTHWAGCKNLREIDSRYKVLDEALYHVDGICWTSAGVTTGIDMALEMIKRDQTSALMRLVAQYLVVYSQRPGTQSQFAAIQDIKPNQEERFANLISWLKKEIFRPVKVSEMAEYMCMSERSFQRRFSASFNVPPSKFFERMRMEYARDFLLPGASVEVSASALGYKSVASFRTSFKKHFGLSPSTRKKIS